MLIVPDSLDWGKFTEIFTCYFEQSSFQIISDNIMLIYKYI